jgi:hypothetical protein
VQSRHGDAGDNKHNRSSTASGCFETADDGCRRRYAAEGRSAVYPSSPAMGIVSGHGYWFVPLSHTLCEFWLESGRTQEPMKDSLERRLDDRMRLKWDFISIR